MRWDQTKTKKVSFFSHSEPRQWWLQQFPPLTQETHLEIDLNHSPTMADKEDPEANRFLLATYLLPLLTLSPPTPLLQQQRRQQRHLPLRLLPPLRYSRQVNVTHLLYSLARPIPLLIPSKRLLCYPNGLNLWTVGDPRRFRRL